MRRTSNLISLLSMALALGAGSTARAQPAGPPGAPVAQPPAAAATTTTPATAATPPTAATPVAPSTPPTAATPTEAASKEAPPPVVLGGYVEAFYQWNFNRPSNGLTNFRGFDNRHNAFTLSNVALDARWDQERLIGRLTLQFGHTPSTYYLAEPVSPGAGGADGSSIDLWKYLQQAYAGYQFGETKGLTVAAGLFLSPIGPESIAVKDNWFWSRSNLFFGLPFYHTGARVSYALSDTWAATLAAYNGWNSVVDNNEEKSLSAQLTYTGPEVALSVLYFGGVERAKGAPEGRAWRHLFDAYGTWKATSWLSLIVHGNSGFEVNEFGTSSWTAGALSGRFRLEKRLFLALRGDGFREVRARNGAGQADALFWPAPWVSSGTATLDVQPHERASFRLEYRHDRAGGEMFFGGTVATTDASIAAPNRRAQNTVTLGLITWF